MFFHTKYNKYIAICVFCFFHMFKFKNPSFSGEKNLFYFPLKIVFHRRCVSYELMAFPILWIYFDFLDAAVHVISHLVSSPAFQIFNIPMPCIDQPLHHLSATLNLSQPVLFVCYHDFLHERRLPYGPLFCACRSDGLLWRIQFFNHDMSTAPSCGLPVTLLYSCSLMR